jgi:hypothetical protein
VRQQKCALAWRYHDEDSAAGTLLKVGDGGGHSGVSAELVQRGQVMFLGVSRLSGRHIHRPVPTTVAFGETLDVRGAFCRCPVRLQRQDGHWGLAMSTEFITVVYGRRTSCGTNPTRSSMATGG